MIFKKSLLATSAFLGVLTYILNISFADQALLNDLIAYDCPIEVKNHKCDSTDKFSIPVEAPDSKIALAIVLSNIGTNHSPIYDVNGNVVSLNAMNHTGQGIAISSAACVARIDKTRK